jgi:hypothetical protein
MRTTVQHGIAYDLRGLAASPAAAAYASPQEVLSRVDAPADVYVNVYPLGKNPPLPAP